MDTNLFLFVKCIGINRFTAKMSRGLRNIDLNISIGILDGVIRFATFVKSPVHLKNGFVVWPNFTS